MGNFYAIKATSNLPNLAKYGNITCQIQVFGMRRLLKIQPEIINLTYDYLITKLHEM